MKPSPEEIVAALNGLIRTCRDTQHLYRSAARLVREHQLKRLFRNHAIQRAAFATALQTEVRHCNGTPEGRGTLGGVLQRVWLSLKSLLLGRRDGVFRAHCARREEVAMKRYEAVSRLVLPPDLQALVAGQYHEIKEAHRHLLDLPPEPVAP